MRHSIILFSFILTSFSSLFANPRGEVRIDILGMRTALESIEGATGMKVMRQSWITDETKKKGALFAIANPHFDKWTSHTLQFKALETGKVSLSLRGKYEKLGDQKFLPHIVWYDDIKLNNKLLPNGDFEMVKAIDQTVIVPNWISNPKKLHGVTSVFKKANISAKQGENAILAWSQNSPKTRFNVEAGQTYSVSFWACPASSHEAYVDQDLNLQHIQDNTQSFRLDLIAKENSFTFDNIDDKNSTARFHHTWNKTIGKSGLSFQGQSRKGKATSVSISFVPSANGSFNLVARPEHRKSGNPYQFKLHEITIEGSSKGTITHQLNKAKANSIQNWIYNKTIQKDFGLVISDQNHAKLSNSIEVIQGQMVTLTVVAELL